MKKLKWFKWLCFLMLISLLIYVYVGNLGLIRESIGQDSANEPLVELTAGNEVGQSFTYHQNNLSGVSFKLATFMRNNTGKLQVGIRELGEDRDIYQDKIEASSIKDNEFYDFRFPPIKSSKEKEYYVYIKSLDGKEGQSITAYGSDVDTYKEGDLFINGVMQNKDLTFKVFYNRTIFNFIGDRISNLF